MVAAQEGGTGSMGWGQRKSLPRVGAAIGGGFGVLSNCIVLVSGGWSPVCPSALASSSSQAGWECG